MSKDNAFYPKRQSNINLCGKVKLKFHSRGNFTILTNEIRSRFMTISKFIYIKEYT